MKSRLALLLALLLAPAVLLAQPKKDRPDTDIEKDMHKISHAYRQLRKQVKDPAQNASSLELVAAIRAGAVDARTHTPLRAADVPAADRAAFEANYQKKMGEFIDAVDQLAAALKGGDNETAAKLTRELDRLQDDDHKDFRRPEKPGKPGGPPPPPAAGGGA
ncbi:MAG TPA: cytochrome b562 [Opitutaceae bacterium]|nr:cytochrome b562 [Opitutaceae bacterium]